jgi:hypothetical protein
MNRLFFGVVLYAALVAFHLACQPPSPYPAVYDSVYEAGLQMAPSGGGGGSTAVQDSTLFEDSTGLEDGEVTASCPAGSTLFANASNPQTITLDANNVYWTNAPATGSGSIGFLARTSTAMTAGTLVPGITNPIFIANANGYVGWSAQTDVGIVNVSSMAATTPGTALTAAAGVAVDTTNVYWISGVSGVAVQSSPVGGGTPNMIGTTEALDSADGLSVQGGVLYFAATAASGGGAIYSVSIGGGTPTALTSYTTGSPSDLVTDSVNVYWTDLTAGGGSLLSMPLTGGAVTTMASALGTPRYMAVDSTNVYTADSTSGNVYEVPIGASAATPKALVTAAASTSPFGVAADDSQTVVYFTSNGTAICSAPK